MPDALFRVSGLLRLVHFLGIQLSFFGNHIYAVLNAKNGRKNKDWKNP
jgi:hypothetical protein